MANSWVCAQKWQRFVLAVTWGCLSALLSAPAGAEPPVQRVGVVVDGNDEFYRRLGKQFKEELSQLVAGEFTMELATGSPVVCDFSSKCVKEKLTEMLASDGIDVVVAQGFLASSLVLERERLPKPVLAPFVVDPRSQSFDPTEKRKNLGFLLWSPNLDSDLRALDQVAPFEELTLLFGNKALESLPEGVRDHLKKVAQGLGKRAHLVLADSVDEALSSLPEATEAVYVGPLLGWDQDEKAKLAKALLERKVPTFSWLGESGVEAGFLMGHRSHQDEKRLARRFALSMQSLLLGETPEPVAAVEGEERVVLNAAVVRALGIDPSVTELLQAKMIGEGREMGPGPARASGGETLSLRQAVDLALKNNVSLQAAQAGVRVTEADAKQARSPLLPQVNLEVGARVIDPDRALPTNRQYQATWGANIRQVLYDERSWGGFSSAKHLTQAQKENQKSTELDVIYDVASAYLDLLRAQTLQEIQKKDLELSRKNLDMAKVRHRVGQAGREEVYRWESRIAQSRRRVLDTLARMQSARVRLNTLLNRPAKSPLLPEPMGVESAELLSSRQEFRTLLGNSGSLSTLLDFIVQEGVSRAPELRELENQKLAVKRQVAAENRSYFIPTIGVDAGVNHRFAQGGEGTLPDTLPVSGLNPDDFDWHVGVSAQLPLFEGALKSSRVGRGNAQADQIELQKKNVELLVEQNVRQSLYVTAASYASIGITEEAAQAAQGNLEIVTNKYQQGRAMILHLLDAQNEAIVAENEAANAVFVFLSDLMRVERAMGRFDFQVTAEQQDEFMRRLRGFETASRPTSSNDANTSRQ